MQARRRRMLVRMKLLVGTAGWTVPKQHLALFSAPGEGGKRSHLERYASRLCCTEINSSFHRPHRRTTEFFDAVRGLGNKLGPVLVQLPPKLAFDDGIAREFFTTLRELHPGAVVLEPRHPSWFTASVDHLLRSFEIARAAADPPKGSKLAARPGGWQSPLYWRLHGVPRTYYSEYDENSMQAFAQQLQSLENVSWNDEVWVIFDNTALGHATANAVWMKDSLG
jgi:uncharacterized protein YecE (DUF72 family)